MNEFFLRKFLARRHNFTINKCSFSYMLLICGTAGTCRRRGGSWMQPRADWLALQRGVHGIAGWQRTARGWWGRGASGRLQHLLGNWWGGKCPLSPGTCCGNWRWRIPLVIWWAPSSVVPLNSDEFCAISTNIINWRSSIIDLVINIKNIRWFIAHRRLMVCWPNSLILYTLLSRSKNQAMNKSHIDFDKYEF